MRCRRSPNFLRFVTTITDSWMNTVGLVPVSSDTADEAINALIASTLTSRAEQARQANAEKDA